MREDMALCGLFFLFVGFFWEELGWAMVIDG